MKTRLSNVATAVLTLMLFSGLAWAVSTQLMTDDVQTFTNDKTFTGKVTFTQTIATPVSTGADAGFNNVTVGGTLNAPVQATVGGAANWSVTSAFSAGQGGSTPFAFLTANTLGATDQIFAIINNGSQVFTCIGNGTCTPVSMGYFKGGQPELLYESGIQTLGAAVKLGGYSLPGVNGVGTARAFTMQAIVMATTVASGGGAGNTVITATDGTNTCTFTVPCGSNAPAGTLNAGSTRIAAVNGAGLGCAFPAGADITSSVTTAGCTTTQPTSNVITEGAWQ